MRARIRARKKVMQIESESPIHVRINSPIAFRKQILTCALETTQLLQEYNEIEEKKKAVLIQKLQKSVSSIEKIEKRFESNLPKVGYKEPERQITPKKSVVAEPLKKHAVTTETEKLQNELEEIERKLAEL